MEEQRQLREGIFVFNRISPENKNKWTAIPDIPFTNFNILGKLCKLSLPLLLIYKTGIIKPPASWTS